MRSCLRILLLVIILAAVVAVPVTADSVQVKFQGKLLDRESRAGGGTLIVEITNILEDPGDILEVGDVVNITYMTGLPPGYQQDFEIDPGATAGKTVEVSCTASGETFSLRDGNYVQALITYTITATAGTGGSISPSGLVMVSEDSDQAFTITADSGNTIDDVLVDSVSLGPVAGYTFSDVAANHTISATFSTAPQGTLYVASYPQGATIYLDGVARGLTDKFVYNVPAGIRNLTLTKTGYQSRTMTIPVPAGDLKVLAPVILTKSGGVTPSGATLYVASYPTGASILIDDINRGTTDGFVYNVAAGARSLTLVKTGYEAKTLLVNVPAIGVKVLAPITLTRSMVGGEIESIQAAVNAASDGDTLVLKAGTYYENIVINKSLTIIGAGPGLTIINGNTGSVPIKGGVINITKPFPHAPTAPNVTLIGMTITEGSANYGGGIFNEGGILTLSQVSVTNSTASFSGGAVYNEMGTLFLNETSISDNSAKVGGGVMNDAGALIMDPGSRVENNTAQLGGGISHSNGVMTLADTCSVTGNTATYGGGGLYLSFYGVVNMNGGSISGNTVESGSGGGIYIDDTSTFNQAGGTVSGNSPDDIYQDT